MPTSNRSAKLIGDAAENASAAALLAGVLLHGKRGAPRNAARTLDVYLNGAGRPWDWQRVTVRMLKWLSADRSAMNLASRSISRRYAALRPPWRLRQVDGLSNWVEAKR